MSSEIIEDKFFKNLKIKTEFGFVPFCGIRKISKKQLYKVKISDGSEIICSMNHRFVVNNKELLLSSLNIGDKLETEKGEYEIVSIIEDSMDYCFDILGVDNKNSSFYANGINNHNCSFSGSTFTLIDGDVLEALKAVDPAYFPREGFYLWKKFDPNRIYIFGVDSAQGANNDYHVINIFDVTTWHIDGKLEQIGLYRRNDIGLFEFEADLRDIAKQFGEPVIIIENNHLGSVLCNNLYFEYGYENVFYDYDKGDYGINANGKTKPLALTYFRADIEEGKMIIHSEDMIRELSYFEEIRTGIFRAREGRGFHDDTIASGYWVSYALRTNFWDDYLTFRLKNHNNNNLNDEATSDEEVLDAFSNFLGADDFDIRKEFNFD